MKYNLQILYNKNLNEIYSKWQTQPCTYYMQILCKRFNQISNEIFVRRGLSVQEET